MRNAKANKQHAERRMKEAELAMENAQRLQAEAAMAFAERKVREAKYLQPYMQ